MSDEMNLVDFGPNHRKFLSPRRYARLEVQNGVAVQRWANDPGGPWLSESECVAEDCKGIYLIDTHRGAWPKSEEADDE